MDVEAGGSLDCVSECGAVHIQGLKFGQLTEVKFHQVEVLLDHKKKIHSGRWPRSVAECERRRARAILLYETPDSLPWEGGFKKKRGQTCFASLPSCSVSCFVLLMHVHENISLA